MSDTLGLVDGVRKVKFWLLEASVTSWCDTPFMGGYLADLDKQYRSDYDPGRRSEIGARAAEQPSAAYAQRRIGVGNPQSRHQAVPV